MGSLQVGDRAPDFVLPDQHGEPVRLSGLLRRCHVVVVFYPFAFSGICTGELREIRETLEDFQDEDIQVVAVSCDPVFSLRAWADAEGYFFPLLSDFWPHGGVARDYGVFEEEKGFAVRGTFLVESSGQVVWSLVNEPSQARDFSGYRQCLAQIRARRLADSPV